MNSSIILLSFLPIFFFIHELEEIFMICPWIKKNRTILYKRFPKLRRIIQKMEQMTTQGFVTIAVEEFLIVITCTFISVQTSNLIPWYCCLAAFGLHLIVHFVQFIVWSGYIPTIVSTVLCLPYCVWAIHDTFQFFPLHELFLYTLLGTLFCILNLIVMHKITYWLSKSAEPNSYK